MFTKYDLSSAHDMVFDTDQNGGDEKQNNASMSMWAVFEQESVPTIQDNLASLSLSLRKRFCMQYSEQIN